MTSLLEAQNGAAWAARGRSLRAQRVVPLYGSGVEADPGAPVYGRVAAPDTAVHTHYERAQRFQVYYESVEVDAGGQRVGAPELDSDERAVARFVARLPDAARVLDLGCNTGRNLERLGEQGAASLHGIDLSADSIEAAERRLAGRAHDVSVGSVSAALPARFVGAHEGAVFTAVAQHLEPRALPQVFANIAQALVSGGLAWVSIKDVLGRAQLSAMGLSAWLELGFTAERALADLAAQPAGSGALAAHGEALEARAAGAARLCRAVMWDDDYYCDPDTAQPVALESAVRRSPSPGPHNRTFNFYPLEHVEGLCRDSGLRMVARRLYLDAKQPYGALHWDMTVQKA